MKKQTTTFDFGNGPVSAHRHSNGGGWVADTAKVTDTVYVGLDARVSGNAQVTDNAQVCGKAQVYGNARVTDTALVSDNAQVFGNARVYDGAWVYGNALVNGNARVYDDGWVSGNARVHGNARINKNMKLSGIMRSDGYTFIAVPDNKGIIRVIAGCRYFTFEEAIEYWKKILGDTELGRETMNILQVMKEQVKLKGYAG